MQGSLVFGRRVVKGGGRSVCEEGMFPAVCRSAAIARNTAVSPICGEALGTWAKPARLHCTAFLHALVLLAAGRHYNLVRRDGSSPPRNHQ